MAPGGRQEGRLEGIIGNMRVGCRNILVDGRINRVKIVVEGLLGIWSMSARKQMALSGDYQVK